MKKKVKNQEKKRERRGIKEKQKGGKVFHLLLSFISFFFISLVILEKNKIGKGEGLLFDQESEDLGRGIQNANNLEN